MSSVTSQTYGIKCEAEVLPLLNSTELLSSHSVSNSGSNTSTGQPPEQGELSVSDKDLVGYLNMDETNLSELTSGINVSEWSSLFNGQLDGIESLDPMTGIQNSGQGPNEQRNMGYGGMTNNGGMDVWLLQETQRLERQQKLQQQKLLELQQTLLKTEILKNQLQIATISQVNPSVSSPSSFLSTESQVGDFNFTPSIPRPQISVGSPPASLGHSPSIPSPGLEPVVPASCGQVSVVPPVPSSRPPAPPLIDTKPLLGPPSPLIEPPVVEGDKRKVHNLIEKKYRCSINDRIGILREKISRNCKDNKRLQKSAVLQKTIDFIDHLEKTVSRLEEENKQLKEALAHATNTSRLPSFGSPPSTPPTLISPKSLESDDSGHSSSEDYLSDKMSREASPSSHMSLSHLLQRNQAPQYLMVVMLVAVFWFNPLVMLGGASHQPAHISGGRSLHSIGGDLEDNWGVYWAMWALKLIVTALCFGWASLRALPHLPGSSGEAICYWRLRKQAERDVQNGDFNSARETLEQSLAAIGRPLPSSYLGLALGLVWSILSHFLFQLMVGHWAISLASLFLCSATPGSKKGQGLSVSQAELSRTYHLLHQINMASTSHGRFHGLNLYLALSALNFGESSRLLLDSSLLAELYFSLGLQSQFVPFSRVFKRYYFHAFRTLTPRAVPLEWVCSSEGHTYLQSGEWVSEVRLGTKLYKGEAALPLYSVSRGFCKTLLCDTFSALLHTDPPSQQTLDKALEAFKWIFGVSQKINTHLLSREDRETRLAAFNQTPDAGFTAFQWWSSVGIVACYWSTGQEAKAESYHSVVEGHPGNESAVPSTLQLAFKTVLTNRKEGSIEALLQLCNMTSNSLSASVSELLNDNFSSTENQLYRLGLLLAADWLLGIRVSIWESKGSVAKGVRQGFYQDLETLAKLVGLLPAGISRLRMYKGCYQLLAGANPVTVQALLGSSGYSRLRRRAQGKEQANSLVDSAPSPRNLLSTPV